MYSVPPSCMISLMFQETLSTANSRRSTSRALGRTRRSANSSTRPKPATALNLRDTVTDCITPSRIKVLYSDWFHSVWIDLYRLYAANWLLPFWLWRSRAGRLFPISSVSAGPESAVPIIPLHTARTSRSVTEVLPFWTGEHYYCPVQVTKQYVL